MTTDAPFFSVVTPVYQTPLVVLRAAIESVRAQTFTDWELILVDDCSPDEAVRRELEAFARLDPRIRIHFRGQNGGISAASNDAVELARGEFLALFDHDDLLTTDALEQMARMIQQRPQTDYAYSDEDKVDEGGKFSDEFHKPDWSPERLRHGMYTCHFSVLRTTLVRDVGGFRSNFDGSQDHDLVLRVTERARQVSHVPKVLYHWRIIPGSAAGSTDAKPYAWLAGQRAVQDHLDRIGILGQVELGRGAGLLRIRRQADPNVRISLIIPTRGQSGIIWGEERWFAVEAVRSALTKTSLINIEIVVVYDLDTPPGMLREIRAVGGSSLVLVPYESSFNFSRKCNLGFVNSTGDVIVLLNDDVEAKSDGWLESLVSPLLDSDVGLVGARLLFSDGTVQHAGHAYGQDVWHHPYRGTTGEDVGHFGVLVIDREVSGVTAACVAIRREVYEEVGGLSEALPMNYNDVDLSYKVRAMGYRILCLADCELYHFESRTRSTTVFAHEADFVKRRWGTPSRDAFMPDLFV
jgi:glycosyltransferase involved in cell wall biosynthesis